MRVVGFILGIVVIVVGAWAGVHYGVLAHQVPPAEVRGDHDSPYIDTQAKPSKRRTVFFMDFGIEPEPKYRPRAAVTTGVQSNPHLP